MINADFVAASRRRRLTDALADLCVERGLARTTVGHIVARTDTSRNTFYGLNANRNDAFIDLIGRAREELLETLILDDPAGGETLEECLRRPLRWVAENSAIASALQLEAPGVGEQGLDLQAAFVAALSIWLLVRVGHDKGLCAHLGLLLAGGMVAVVRGELLILAASEIPALSADLACSSKHPLGRDPDRSAGAVDR